MNKKLYYWYDIGSLSCRCGCCGCKTYKPKPTCPACGAHMAVPNIGPSKIRVLRSIKKYDNEILDLVNNKNALDNVEYMTVKDLTALRNAWRDMAAILKKYSKEDK